jgi:hypothetical protein
MWSRVVIKQRDYIDIDGDDHEHHASGTIDMKENLSRPVGMVFGRERLDELRSGYALDAHDPDLIPLNARDRGMIA